MGRVAEYKDEDIINTGVELEKKGEQVTPSAIRKKLGGGSSVRIKEVWNNFLNERDKQSSLDKTIAEIELPHELQSLFEKQSDTLITAIKRFSIESYKTSESLSEKKVKARIEEYNIQIDRLEKAENEALEEIDAYEKQLVKYDELKTALIAKNDELQKQNAGLLGQIKRLEESVAKHDEVQQRLAETLKENGKLQYIVDNIESQLSKPK
jgi:hypothetical protein